jgi:hypothetical protein
MVRKMLLLGLLASLCGAASAAAPKEKGFYLGAAGGLSLYDDDGALGIGTSFRATRGEHGFRMTDFSLGQVCTVL